MAYWIKRIEMGKRVEGGSFPHLEKLYIWNNKLMECLPSGIEHLSSLTYLELIDMSERLISSLSKDFQEGDHWKIEHILK